MANNDFNLAFGSNAGPFATKLSTEIQPATQSILGLIEALERYEGALDKARSGNTPLNNLFGRLDQATAQFSELTSGLVSGFSKAITSITELRGDLTSLVNEIKTLPTATARSRKGILTATTTDVTAAKATREQNAQQKAVLDLLSGNAKEARNALKRVSDINKTLITNAGGAADKLSLLGQSIRDLRTAATEARDGLAGGIGGGPVTVVMAGGENVAGAANVNVQELINALARNVGGAVVGKAAVAATDAAADAAAAKVTKGVVPLTSEELKQPARPGLYSPVGGEARPVGFDAYTDRGETFEKYFERKNRETAAVQQIRETMPQGDPADLKAYNLFRATGGKQSQEVYDRVVSGEITKMDQVRASYPGLQLGALMPSQIKNLPDILRRVNTLEQAQLQHATGGLTSLLQSSPFSSFQGGVIAPADPTREVGDIIRKSLRQIDERILSGDPDLNFGAAEPGAQFRAEARANADALQRKDFKTRASDFTEYNDATVTEQKLRGVPTPAADVKAGRAANLEATQEFIKGPRTPEQIAAQAARSPEVAAINAQIRRLQEQRGTSAGDAEIATMLGIQPTATRDVVANNQGMQALQARANASGLRNILQSDPDVIISKLAQEQEDFIRRATGIKSHNTDVAASRSSLERLSDPATAQAEAERILQERMQGGMAGFEQAQVRHGINVTEDQHAEAVAQLETQREVLIQEGIARLTAAGATPPPTAAPVLQTPDVKDEPVVAAAARASRAAPATDEMQALQTRIDEINAQKQAVQAQMEPYGGWAGTKSERKGGLPPGPDRDALLALRTQFNALSKEVSPLNSQMTQLSRATASATAAEEKKAATGGGGGRRPPRPPAPPATGGGGGGDDGGDDDEQTPGQTPRRRNRNGVIPDANFASHVGRLQDETQADLEELRAQLELIASTKQLTAEQHEAILQTAARYRNDPYVRTIDAEQRARTFSQATGLTADVEGGLAYSRRLFAKGGYLKSDARFNQGGEQATSADQAAVAEQRLAEAEERAAATTRTEEMAILRLIQARERLRGLQARATTGSAVNPGQMLGAEREVMAAEGALEKVRNTQDEQEGGVFGRKLFGQRGFIDSQLRHFGQAIENIAGYTLVFSGFQKLRELVDTGIQADAAFVKLQGELDATGRSTGQLRTQLQGVSSATAQSLPAVVEAATELTGVFKSNSDLIQGTRVAAELANISQGTLTAKEAAVGLRDVTDAYGISGAQGIRAVGDEITRLHQITGVSIKDVMEGTTQLAQESRMLSPNNPQRAQRMSAVLSAFVTRSTGETGESAAEQVSRILSQLNVGRVQKQLEQTRIPGTKQTIATPQMFASGEMGTVLENLLTNFDKLAPAQQQTITAMIGTGRQARAFAGLLRDAAAAAKELDNAQQDTGALAQQNQRFLNSLAGTIKSLENDFKNLGATLQQWGVFDILGLFAKSLDDVLKVFNSTFGAIAQFFNSNPITKGLKDIIVVTGEAALAFRLLGGIMGKTLGSTIQPGRQKRAILNSVGDPVMRDGKALKEFVPVTFGGAVGGTRNALFGQRQVDDRGNLLRDDNGALLGRTGGILRPSTWRNAPSTLGERLSNFFTPVGGGIVEEGESRFSAAAQSRLSSTIGEDVAATRSQRVMNTVAVAARGATDHMGRLGSALQGITPTGIGATVAIAGVSYALDQLANVHAKEAKAAAANRASYDELTGKTAEQGRAKNRGDTHDPTPQQLTADAENHPGFWGSLYRGLESPIHDNYSSDPNVKKSSWTGRTHSTGFDAKFDTLMKGGFSRLTAAKGNASALVDADKQNTEDIKKFAEFAKGLGLNNQQNANAQNELKTLQLAFASTFANLHGVADGISKIDQLNATQIGNLQTALQQAESLTSGTLVQTQGVAAQVLDASGLAVGSAAYNDLATSFGYNPMAGRKQIPVGPIGELPGQAAFSSGARPFAQTEVPGRIGDATRLQAEINANKAILRSTDEYFADPSHDNPNDAQPGGYQDQAKKAADAQANLQQQTQALQQLSVGNPAAKAAMAEATGKNQVAIAYLERTNSRYTDINKTLSVDDPAFISNLKAIQDNKLKIAQLQFETSANAADLAAASTNDPLLRANAALSSAYIKQSQVAAQPGGGSQADRSQADIGVAQAVISAAQAHADLLEAKYQETIAGRVQNRALIQSQINDILRQESLAAGGTLASQQQLAQLKGQEAQLRAQAVQVAADTKNAATEEKIAQLQARGLAGDLQKAARLAVQEARNKARQYLQQPGATKGDPQYKQLVGQISTAIRASFDQTLQDQMDTLDFQHEMFQITAAQEIAGLKNLLKQKQLTLKERRDILLKIKSLNELSAGQFNLGDIKIPSVYDAQRQATTANGLTTKYASMQQAVTNNQVSITFNGANNAQILALLEQYLGVSSTSRFTTTSTKIV